MSNKLMENENFIKKQVFSQSISINEINTIKELGKNFNFLSMDVDDSNDPYQLIYYVSGLEKINKYIECRNSISNRTFVKILLEICKSFLQCEQNRNVDEEKIYLVEDYIFIDPLSEKIRFMYSLSPTSNSGKPIDKLRLLLLNLIDKYVSKNYMSANIVKKLKGELTFKFIDIYTLIENLNKLINSLQEKPIQNTMKIKNIDKSGSNNGINKTLLGSFLIIVVQLITVVLSVSLYKLNWDNPNLMLVSIIFVIILDLFITFIIANYLVLPNVVSRKNQENTIMNKVGSNGFEYMNHEVNNSKNIITSNITSEGINIQEYSGSTFLEQSSKEYVYDNGNDADETTYLDKVSMMGGDSDETTLLTSVEGEFKIAYLISEGNGTVEKVTINKEEFVVGRLKQKVDYPIQNQTVGKVHAKINRIDNKFYLTDLESKNGTYVNGNKLMPLEKFEIVNADEIIFSNVVYTFRV